MTTKGTGIRHEHDLGRPGRDPRDVHAGGLRLPGGRADADEERRPHRGEERPRPGDRVARLLRRRLRHRLRRRRQRAVGRLRLPAVRRRAADDRSVSVQLVRADPRRRGLSLRGRLLRSVAGDRVGRHGRTDAAVGLLRVRRRLHADLLARLALDLEPRRLAVLEGHAGLRRLDRRPLPGCARGPRGGAAARAADRQVRARREAQRHPRPQHGVHHARRDHPLVRLVRLQRRARRSASISAASASSPTSR